MQDTIGPTGADPYWFHRFTEIGQIFYKKYIFSKKL